MLNAIMIPMKVSQDVFFSYFLFYFNQFSLFCLRMSKFLRRVICSGVIRVNFTPHSIQIQFKQLVNQVFCQCSVAFVGTKIRPLIQIDFLSLILSYLQIFLGDYMRLNLVFFFHSVSQVKLVMQAIGPNFPQISHKSYSKA